MEKKKNANKTNPKTVKKTTIKKKSKKKGFTLIELLAVIIILGVLMIIAIPAVTSYISNSRKSAYVNTAQNIVAGARTKVNDGSLGMYDTDTTYYIPYDLIKGENELKSPYGDFTGAYVVATFSGTNYDYYWTSVDSTKTGMYLTYADSLDSDKIVNDMGSIDTTIGVGTRKKIIVFNSDGTILETKNATERITDKGNYVEVAVNECTFDGNLVQGAEYVNGDYTYKYKREKYGSDSWTNISTDGWGVALTDPTITDITSNLCTSINGKPIVSMSYMFADARNLSTIDVSSFDTRNVVSMRYMFYNAGFNTTEFRIIGISHFRTGNVRDMSRMFSEMGHQATKVYIGDLSNFNTSNVTNMSDMFRGAAYSSELCDIGDLSNWDTSKVTTMYYMFDYGFYSSKNFSLDLSEWDVSNVTSMSSMFYNSGYNSTDWTVGDLSNWDVGNVTNMTYLFGFAGGKSTVWDVGDLSNWDTSKVTTMEFMISNTGRYATTWNDMGTIKVYSGSMRTIFYDTPRAKATVNIYSNPSNYDSAFMGAAKQPGSGIVVNYTSAVTDIDNIIATKSDTSNVTKGSLINN